MNCCYNNILLHHIFMVFITQIENIKKSSSKFNLAAEHLAFKVNQRLIYSLWLIMYFICNTRILCKKTQTSVSFVLHHNLFRKTMYAASRGSGLALRFYRTHILFGKWLHGYFALMM
jgi:hypothetical protein